MVAFVPRMRCTSNDVQSAVWSQGGMMLLNMFLHEETLLNGQNSLCIFKKGKKTNCNVESNICQASNLEVVFYALVPAGPV